MFNNFILFSYQLVLFKVEILVEGKVKLPKDDDEIRIYNFEILNGNLQN